MRQTILLESSIASLVKKVRLLSRQNRKPRKMIYQLISIMLRLREPRLRLVYKICLKHLRQIKQKQRQRIQSIREAESRLEDSTEKLKLAYKQVKEAIKANKHKPISIYKLVLDPKNYLKSYDNVLQIEYLMERNLIDVVDGPDGYPHVKILNYAEMRERLIPGRLCPSIGMLNFVDCAKFKQLYGIRKPLLNLEEDTEEEGEEGEEADEEDDDESSE